MTDSAEGQDTRKQGTNAAPGHATGFNTKAVTATRLFDLLWPGASSYQIAAALGARVSPAHVRMWRTGARPLPAWIRDLARARAAAIADTVEAAPTGPGVQAGWRNISKWRAAQNQTR